MALLKFFILVIDGVKVAVIVVLKFDDDSEHFLGKVEPVLPVLVEHTVEEFRKLLVVAFLNELNYEFVVVTPCLENFLFPVYLAGKDHVFNFDLVFAVRQHAIEQIVDEEADRTLGVDGAGYFFKQTEVRGLEVILNEINDLKSVFGQV